MSNLSDPEPASNGRADGEQLRDAALYRLTLTRGAIIRRLQRAAVRLALERGVLTADDVRDAVPIPPAFDPKLNGAVFSGLAGLGILRGDGYRKSRRPIAHARPNRVWHLDNPAAALNWLTANPEYPDPTT